jgi:uncharacterized protein DUF4242
MPEFVVELYVARTDATAIRAAARRARLAAQELTVLGTPVRYLRSIFIPEDETCFLLYEAASHDAVRVAVARAHLPSERIAEVVPEPNQPRSVEAAS